MGVVCVPEAILEKLEPMSSSSPPLHHSSRPCVPSPQESPLEQLSSPSVQLPCPAAILPLGFSAPRPVISCSDIPPRKNVVVSNFKCVGLLLDYWGCSQIGR